MQGKWLLGIMASLIVAGIAGAFGQTMRVESRVSRLEEAKQAQDQRAKELKDEVRENAKEVRAEFKEVRANQAEQTAILRELAAKTAKK